MTTVSVPTYWALFARKWLERHPEDGDLTLREALEKADREAGELQPEADRVALAETGEDPGTLENP